MGFLDDIPDSFKARQKRPQQKVPNVVIWHIIRCPKCGWKKTPVKSKVARDNIIIRYHKCEKCGYCFKSIEK